MKTFKTTQTLIERANLPGIRSHILHLDGQISAYRDIISKCEHDIEVMRHNRQLLLKSQTIKVNEPA